MPPFDLVCLFAGLQYVSPGLDAEISVDSGVFPANRDKKEPTSGLENR
jgi:hypothetical protein